MRLLFLFTFSLGISTTIFAQDFLKKKSLKALRVDETIEIDAVLNEKAWSQAEKATDFVMVEPGDGDLERKGEESEVSVVYDDKAIYVSGRFYFKDSNNIQKQLGSRDDLDKVTDIFIVSINPYNDGQQVFNFIVTAAGVQADEKNVNGDGDMLWNAVWDSEVKIDDKGWVAEIEIPYSELRFPESDVQLWAINFLRSNKYKNEEYTWNYIDKSVGEYTLHYGELKGLENIKPPVRLSFLPYMSGYNYNSAGISDFSYSAGMDVKYGINEAFTLDMTLIPDFGQTAFDDLILNLGPFEVRYRENRSFFTEGTELFSKGDLFYSRRIGNTPSDYYSVQSNIDTAKQSLISNPSSTPLLNATKVSGRTKSGLGIGVFNAVTNQARAVVKNKDDGKESKVITEPYANYNLIVLDQRFNNNSSISLVNSNVLRQGDYRDANVSAFLFDIANNSNSYKIFGTAKYSNVMEVGDSNKTGYEASLGFAKIQGNWRFEHQSNATSQNYDNTDLGFMRESNILENDTEVSYQIFEPNDYFNKFRIRLGAYHDRRLVEDHFIKLNMRLSFEFTDLDFLSYGGNIRVSPFETFDFFEPRSPGRVFIKPQYYTFGAWISTDYRKRFAIDVWTGAGFFTEWMGEQYEINIMPRFRVNDKLFFTARAFFESHSNDVGYANTLSDGGIIMGFRDKTTVISSLETSYIFNSDMSASLSFRHYWADVRYSDFMELNNRGYLDKSTYIGMHDTTFNSWNMDLNFSWWFAPGSQMTFLYRNSLVDFKSEAGKNYFSNLEDIFDLAFDNTFSIRLTYFLDYNKL